MEKKIVGIGEALWDCLPEGSKLGGAPANFAYHVSQFGYDSWAISALGNDALGDETINRFQATGLKHIMPIVGYPTGTVQVTLDAEGVPTYDIKSNVAWDNIPFTMIFISKNVIIFFSRVSLFFLSLQYTYSRRDIKPKTIRR